MSNLHEELVLLNEAMNDEGRAENFHTLIFYTPVLAHKVEFDVNVFHARYMISNLEKNKEEWGWLVILQNGTLEDAATTLESYRPFLPLDQIDNYWENINEIL